MVQNSIENPLLFTLDGVTNRERRAWCRAYATERVTDSGIKIVECRSAVYSARRWAATHGAAGMWNADDSFILFYREGTTVRQKTWRHARPVDFSEGAKS